MVSCTPGPPDIDFGIPNTISHHALCMGSCAPYLTRHCVWCPIHHTSLGIVYGDSYTIPHQALCRCPIHHTSPGIVYGVPYTIPHQALCTVSHTPYLTRHCVQCPIHHTSPGIVYGVPCTIPHQALCMVSHTPYLTRH
jgi:hypothetical protein